MRVEEKKKMTNLLVELQTEELPPKALEKLSEAFAAGVEQHLRNRGFLAEGSVTTAYGSPWSGKTPCYKNESAPLAGVIRLRQAPANRFEPMEDIAAFSLLLPGCSVLRQDKKLHGTPVSFATNS